MFEIKTNVQEVLCPLKTPTINRVSRIKITYILVAHYSYYKFFEAWISNIRTHLKNRYHPENMLTEKNKT